MSPFRATLLHSPGWNEGKARYETLGTHKTKSYMSSVGAALQRKHLPYVSEVPPLKGLNKCTITNNPGLAPWAMKKYRPVGALLHLVVVMVVTRRTSNSLRPTKNRNIMVMLGTL